MIVIPRKKGESIIIGDDIIVTVVEIRGDKVRLGIEHPPEVPVHRQEVFDAIRRARQTAERPRPERKARALSFLMTSSLPWSKYEATRCDWRSMLPKK